MRLPRVSLRFPGRLVDFDDPGYVVDRDPNQRTLPMNRHKFRLLRLAADEEGPVAERPQFGVFHRTGEVTLSEEHNRLTREGGRGTLRLNLLPCRERRSAAEAGHE